MPEEIGLFGEREKEKFILILDVLHQPVLQVEKNCIRNTIWLKTDYLGLQPVERTSGVVTVILR